MASFSTYRLEEAFEEVGCPICLLVAESEDAFLEQFLWEGVNDPFLRGRLLTSLGFCRDHAWQVVDKEARYGGTGVGIVYEHLGRQTLAALESHLKAERVRLALAPTGWRRAAQRWLKRLGLTRSSNASFDGLEPRTPCPACQVRDEAEQRYASWLVEHLNDLRFRQAFAESDGLCLPHLRLALALADEPAARTFLIETMSQKIGTLAHDLSEYGRKHNWQYRGEAKTENELKSWIRAVAWFVGEKRG
ncbi:MAG: DUF6062 family protein [Chloroflexota bacterium]